MIETKLFPIFVRQGRSRTRSKVGYIDEQGHVVEPLFDDGTRFYEGLAAVKAKNRWGVINTRGAWCRFHNGLASLASRIGKYDVVDSAGNFVVEPKLSF